MARFQSDRGFPYKNYPVADGEPSPGDGHTVLFKGIPLALSGNGIKVGDLLRDVQSRHKPISRSSTSPTQKAKAGAHHQRRAIARHESMRAADPLSQREEQGARQDGGNDHRQRRHALRTKTLCRRGQDRQRDIPLGLSRRRLRKNERPVLQRPAHPGASRHGRGKRKLFAICKSRRNWRSFRTWTKPSRLHIS